MNLSSDQGWSSDKSTCLPPMWPGYNATVFVSSLNAPPQQTAKGGALRDETKTVAREANWLQHNLLAGSPCMGSEASCETLFSRAALTRLLTTPPNGELAPTGMLFKNYPLTLMDSESIAHSAFGLMGY